MTECPDCGHALDTEETNDALADDPEHDYFCINCGGLYSEEELSESEDVERTPPGIYLVNASGEMVALHTEDGAGDIDLLRSYLRDSGLFGEMFDFRDPNFLSNRANQTYDDRAAEVLRFALGERDEWPVDGEL